MKSFFHVHVSFGDLEALIQGTYETDRSLPVHMEVWKFTMEGRIYKSEDYESPNYASMFNRLIPELEKRLRLPRGTIPYYADLNYHNPE